MSLFMFVFSLLPPLQCFSDSWKFLFVSDWYKEQQGGYKSSVNGDRCEEIKKRG